MMIGDEGCMILMVVSSDSGLGERERKRNTNRD